MSAKATPIGFDCARHMLRGERVDDMLVDEVRVAVRQRVGGQLVASGLLRG